MRGGYFVHGLCRWTDSDLSPSLPNCAFIDEDIAKGERDALNQELIDVGSNDRWEIKTIWIPHEGTKGNGESLENESNGDIGGSHS